MSEAAASQGFTPVIRPEGTMDRSILRRCTPCLDNGIVTPHPLATGDPDGSCPKCGAPSSPPEPLETLTIGVQNG